MAVYDRAMFRGSRPKAAADAVGSMAGVAKKMAGPMVQQGIAGVMQDMTKGVKSAKNYEQAMNAFRGDEKSVGERRKELGGIVGMKDAKKTPESVLTLVQPVMEMREIKERGSVDQGIGQVAEKAMDTPVDGKMAQGIMQPLKLKPGGPVSLRDYYEKNLPIIQDIYGDTGAEARKDALGQFLLSAAAPAGLAVARGDMDIGEALMATLPVLAQTGAQAKAATRKEKLAQRDAALKMAISDQAAAREAAAAAKKVQFAAPGSAIVRDGKVIGNVAPKPEGFRTVYKLDPTEPLGYLTREIGKNVAAPEGFTSDKPDIKTNQYYDKTTKKLVVIPDILANQSERYVPPGNNTIIDAYDANTGAKVKVPFSTYNQNPAAYTMDDPNATTDVYFNSTVDLEIDGESKKFLPGVPYAIPNSVKNSLPIGSFSTKKPADAKDEPQVTNVTPTEDIVFNGQTLPAGQMIASLPRDFYQKNISKFKTKDAVSQETAQTTEGKKLVEVTAGSGGTVNVNDKQMSFKAGETRKIPRADYDAIVAQNPDFFGKLKDSEDKLVSITAKEAFSVRVGDRTITLRANETRQVPRSVYDSITSQLPNVLGKIDTGPAKPAVITVRATRDTTLPSGALIKKGQVKEIPYADYEADIDSFEAPDQKKTAPSKLTESQARTNIEPLATAINNGDFRPETIRDFEANLGAIRARSGTGQIAVAGGILPEQPGVTSNVYRALQAITDYQTNQFRTANPGDDVEIPEGTLINDYGILDSPVPPEDPEFVQMVASVAGDFDTSNLGILGAGKRGINKVSSVLTQLATGNAAIPFDDASSAVKTVTALNDYALGVFISSVGRQNTTVINSFTNTQPKAASLTETPNEIAKSASLTAIQLNNRAQRLRSEANELPRGNENIKKAANLESRALELEALAEDYTLLANLLRGSGPQSPGATTGNYEAVFE